MKRPGSDEYLPYYAHYIGLVGSGDVVGILESQIRETVSLLRSIPDSRGTFRYAPGKWSINEVVGHLIDAERIFAVRALRFARLKRYREDKRAEEADTIAQVCALLPRPG